jgi:protein arginine kinase
MSDVVISSRIRLARNVSGNIFVNRLSPAKRREVERKSREAILHANLAAKVIYVDLEQATDNDRQLLVERHLISKQHAAAEGARGVAVTEDETVSIMVNEEDHLRLQVLRSGFQLDEAWEQIDAIDTRLDEQLKFAFHNRFGYLTACPTNVGTGIRVSVMLHLPAMKLTGEIEKVFRAAKDLRLAVRGLYGEGTEATGDFYQVSNQTTLGKDEEQIISNFRDSIIPKIIQFEHQARRRLMEERAPAIEDKIFRALGILKSARMLAGEEVLFLLSHLRMGVTMGRIKSADIKLLNELFLMTQQAHLQRMLGKSLDGDIRRVARADYVRAKLAAVN